MKTKEIIKLLNECIKNGTIKPDQEIKFREHGKYVDIDYILTKPDDKEEFACLCTEWH